MKIGDVVVPSRITEKVLHCGSGVYTHAIVGSVDPFVLVSSSGDMVWTETWNPQDVVPLCQASEDVQATVQRRLAATHQHLQR